MANNDSTNATEAEPAWPDVRLSKSTMNTKMCRHMYGSILASPSGMWLHEAARKFGPAAMNAGASQSLLRGMTSLGVYFVPAEKDKDNQGVFDSDIRVMAYIPKKHGTVSIPPGWHPTAAGVGIQCSGCGVTKDPAEFEAGYKECKPCAEEKAEKLAKDLSAEKFKICTCCGVNKPSSSFSISKGGSLGVRSECKACISKNSKERLLAERKIKEEQRMTEVRAKKAAAVISKADSLRKQAEELLAAAEEAERQEIDVLAVSNIIDVQLHVARAFAKCQRLFDEIVDAMDDMEKASSSLREAVEKIKRK